jgi:hypothetical protein
MAMPEMAAMMTVAAVMAAAMMATTVMAAAMMATTVMAAAMMAAAMMAAAMMATAVAAACQCGRVGRGHQHTRYADGRQAIEADQRGTCQAGRQELANFALSVPGHFIHLFCARCHALFMT